MKSKPYLKGLGSTSGGAFVILDEFESSLDLIPDSETPYDIKVVTNITDGGVCCVSENTYDLKGVIPNYIRTKIDSNGVAYLLLPQELKYRYVDISIHSLRYNNVRVSEMFYNGQKTEMAMYADVDVNY